MLTTCVVFGLAVGIMMVWIGGFHIPFEIDEAFLTKTLDNFWYFNPNDWTSFCILFDGKTLVLPVRMSKRMFLKICQLNGILLRSKK